MTWCRWKLRGFCLWPQSACTWNVNLNFQSKLDLRFGKAPHYYQNQLKFFLIQKLYFEMQCGKYRPFSGYQAVIFIVASLTINMILPIHSGNVLLKFGSDIRSCTKVWVHKLKDPIWSPNDHCENCITENQKSLPIYTSNMLMKFGVDIQSQAKVRVRKPKIPIWPPDNHFESEITENRKASFDSHK